ncbi:DNRLRE domain-containing protein [Streptomyces sp. GSL17-111]|uniref:DNRLRE domain-containing protein n=1 Tax=Streptomyces sp. GSL17-111 TaxID=3121596 RepID=UPI0030F42841
MAAVDETKEADGTGEETTPARARRFRRPSRRGAAVLATLVALALALPLGIHLTGDDGEAPEPAARSKAEAPLDAEAAAEKARETGEDVEVETERGATATTWAQPDGYLRTRVHSDTIRAETEDGWQEIDTDLEEVAGGYAPKAVNDPLLFSAGTPDEGPRPQLGRDADATTEWTRLVRLTTGGHELTVSWPGPLPEPLVSGPRALYENVRPGIDLLMTARDSGYSHVLIVHDRDAAQDPLLERLRYRLSSPDLTFRLNAASDTVQAVDADGNEVAASPTAFAWDSAGKPAVTLGEEPDVIETVSETLNLPGLAGPRPGAHDAVLAASLDEDTGEDVLTVTPEADLLAAEDTVFPLFIDPSFKGRKKNWTLLYKKYPDSSFYNGQNFNDGTNEARVGYESTTGGLSRSVFTFYHDSDLHGASIKSATFRTLQTYSWGCSARKYNLWLTSTINSGSSWSDQPSWYRVLDSETNGHGYKSGSCPDKWVGMNIKSAAQEAADKEWSTLTLGLRAASETDTNAWKKFRANGENSPYIEIVYNRTPNQPTNQTMTPGPDCDLTSPYASVGKHDLTFRARGSDPDGNLKYLHFAVYPTGDFANAVYSDVRTPDSNGYASITLPWEDFTDGGNYSWGVRSWDTDGAKSTYAPLGPDPCRFVIDHSAPPTPTVSSDDFPAPGDDGGVWSTVRFGTAGSVTFATESGAGTDHFEYSLNSGSFDRTSPDAASDGTATVSFEPTYPGPNLLYVRAVDGVGNKSPEIRYLFYVTPADTLDAPGDLNGDGTPDLLAIDRLGNLRTYPAADGGAVHIHTAGAHDGGAALDDGYWFDDAGEPVPISHTGDWFPGDGISDLLARMPDGELYLYPGDGYGSFDVGERLPVLLPEDAPDPATLTQLVTTEDSTGDGHPDAFALAGDELWAFTGYTGGAFTSAHRLDTDAAWETRDLVLVGDLTGDDAADLLFRTGVSGEGLKLRHGKPGSGGGVNLESLGSGSASGTGQDEVYDTSAWLPEHLPVLRGTPDANGDGVPDFWATTRTGLLYFYPGGAETHGTRVEVGSSGWQQSNIPALG